MDGSPAGFDGGFLGGYRQRVDGAGTLKLFYSCDTLEMAGPPSLWSPFFFRVASPAGRLAVDLQHGSPGLPKPSDGLVQNWPSSLQPHSVGSSESQGQPQCSVGGLT